MTWDELVQALRRGGVLQAEEEAHQLLATTSGSPAQLRQFLERRLSGEPLARILGRVTFADVELQLDPQVYVPRWTSQWIAHAAVARLPESGAAIDLCTGSGAVAAVLGVQRPGATILATDIHEPSVRCARANGVDAHLGDLFAPLPRSWAGSIDVVVSVPPFVPTMGLSALAAEVIAHERVGALDGGKDGLGLMGRIAREAHAWLRPRGALVVELSPYQVEAGEGLLSACGYIDLNPVVDPDGDVCGLVGMQPDGP